MAQLLEAPALGVMSETQLARDGVAAWLTPAEVAAVRAVCAEPPTAATKGVLRERFGAGATWWSLLTVGGVGDFAWPPEDPAAVLAQAAGSIRNRRRRRAVRVWADAHGVSRQEAAQRFGLGWV